MPVFLDPPVDVTPATLGVYTDVDVSAQVSGQATGAILRVANASGVDRKYHLRSNGGSGDLYQDIDAAAQNWEVVALKSGVFEARLESADLSLEISGYFEDEATFAAAPINVTPAWDFGVYLDVDIAALTDAATARAAFLLFYPVSTTAFARVKGASGDRAAPCDNRQPLFAGVDASEVLEARSGSLSQRLYLTGWMTGDVAVASEPVEIVPSATDTWETHALPAGATGAVLWFTKIFGAASPYGARKKGSGLAWNADLSESAGFAVVAADENAEIELYFGAISTRAWRLATFFDADDYDLAVNSMESATELSSFDLTINDNYDLAINSAESATELSSFDLSHGIDASPPVIALAALPFDTSIEVMMDGPPAPFSSVAFGETEFSSFGAETAIYASDVGYHSHAGDDPAAMPFLPRMMETAQFEVRAFDGDRPAGASKEQSGAIALVNSDGRYDDAALLGWDGRSVELWQGTQARAFRDFTLLLRGTAERVSFDEQRFVIALRDRQSILDQPINFALYGGAGGLDGHSGIAGLAKPVALGRVGNVPAVNIDPVNLVYQLHDGAIEAIEAVRDKGIELTVGEDQADYTALIGATIAGGEYDTCLALGLIRLGASPDGGVTVDLQGDASGSGYVETTAGLLRRVVTSRLGGGNLSGSEIDTSSLDALAAAQPAPVGYWAGTQQVTCRQVLDSLAGGIGGWHAFTREGKFTAARLDLAGTVRETIRPRETAARAPAQRVEVAPVWQVRIGWGRSWLVQSADALAGTVDDDDRAYFGQAVRYAVQQDSTIRARHRLAVPLTVDGYFAEQADAETEAARLLALYGPDRDIWSLGRAGRIGKRWIGDAVSLDLARYGHPKTCQVIGLREDYGRGELSLVLWG